MDPKLPNKLYTEIFETLIRLENFTEFLQLLQRLPTYLINQDQLIQHLERTHKQTNNPLLFDTKFYLYKLNRDYENALKVAIKRADPDLLFDFLN